MYCEMTITISLLSNTRFKKLLIFTLSYIQQFCCNLLLLVLAVAGFCMFTHYHAIWKWGQYFLSLSKSYVYIFYDYCYCYFDFYSSTMAKKKWWKWHLKLFPECSGNLSKVLLMFNIHFTFLQKCVLRWGDFRTYRRQIKQIKTENSKPGPAASTDKESTAWTPPSLDYTYKSHLFLTLLKHIVST